jgi:hypothetical protein
LGASQRDTGTRVPEESFAVAAITAFADYRLHAVVTARARGIFIAAFAEQRRIVRYPTLSAASTRTAAIRFLSKL